MKTTRNKSAAISCGRNWQTGKRAFFKLSRIVLFTVILAWSLVGQKSFSQGVGISETSITPDTWSILELRSSLRGFLAPRMTTAERNILGAKPPATGMLVYDTDTKSFWYYDGGWKAVMGSGTLGTNNQLLGMNATGSFNEYKTLNGTQYQINVTFPTAGSIVLSTPQNIHTGAIPTFLGLIITNNATVGGTLGVTGATTLGGTLGVTGSTTTNGISNTGTIANTGNITNTLDISTATLSTSGLATLNSASVTTDLTVTGVSTMNGNVTLGNALNDVVTISGTVQPGTLVAGQSALVFDGSTADATNRTTFNITEPTAARTINFPDRSGTVVLSGSPTLGNNLAVSTDATGQLVNAIDGQVFNVNSDVINLGNAVGDQITIAGNVKANNGIDVLGGNLAVTNNATVGGTLGVTGATTLGGTLGVTGSTTTNGISNTGTIANTGNITNTLDISTATLSTSGLATLNSASVTTDLTVTGVSTMNGNVTLGNALNDVVTISGTVQPGTLVAGQSALVFDGSTADATNRTTFNITEPTAARTINFPDRSGTVVLSGSPTLGNNLAVSTDATGQLVNAIDGQVFNVNSDVINLGNAVGDQITIAGNVKANNGIDVLGGNLAVTNNATVGGTLGVTGATTLGGTLGVTGSTTTNGISNTGTIANTGNITNTLDISTATLSTSGLATLNSASVTTDLTVTGVSTMNGNVTLGNALNDVVTISGTVQPGTLVAGQSALVFDGSTADATNRTTFNITEPTAARTINFPDRSGTVVLSGSPTLGNNLAVSTDATGQLVNAIDGQVFNVNSDVINLGNAVGDQITIAGNVKANNGIDVLGGNLAVTNNATVGGTLGVTGATTLGGTLGVTGSTTTNGISNTGTIANTGNITNTLDISTATLSTSGLATLNSASVTTDLTVTGVSTMNGNVTLGNALNDVVTISGTVQPGTLVAGQSALVFDGSTADATNRTTFNITEPTAARTINFPDRSGTVVLSGSPTLGNNLAVSTDATGQLVNAIDGQVFNVNSDVINLGNAVGDQITIAGNVKANNGIDVLGGNLAVTNNATVGGTLGVTGATTLGGTLGVTGSTTTNGISNTGTIANTGNITNTLDISTATLSTSGLATLNSASVTTDLTVTGVSTMNGNVTLGNALNDVVTISGTVQPGTLVAGQSALVFDGSTADATNRTTFNITEPTAARTINFPDRSGTVVLSGSPTLGNNLAVSTDATGQLVNAIDGQVFNVNSDVINLGNAVGDQITIAGNVKANNGIDVLGGNLAVTNNATVGGTLGVTGATTLGGTLGVTGSTTTNGISNTGTIANTGNITNTLDISTATLSTSGLATLNSASVTTDLTVTGVSTMNGNVTLGNALNDVVTISGTVQPGTLVAGQSALVFDGSTADATNRTTFNITEPTAARTINFPDRSGTVVLSGSPTLGNNLAVSTDATGQLVNAIDGQVFNVNSDVINLGNAVGDQITIAGNVKANNGIDVLGGNLAVTNNATVGGTLGVTGATTLGGTLGVTGSTTTNGISNTGTIANTGNITNTLDISTATLSTSGLATLNSASVTTDLTVTGVSTMNGNVTLGNALNDVVTISGTVQPGTLVAGQSALVFDGSTADATNRTTFNITEPTAARTINFPDRSGTVVLSGSPTLGNNLAVSTDATGQLVNAIDGQVFNVNSDVINLGNAVGDQITIAGNVKANNGIDVLGGNLAVTNNATVGGTLGVTGATTLGGTLGVTGSTTTNGISNTGTIANTGNITNTLDISTATLSTSGLATLNSASVTTDLTVTGVSTMNGNVTLGNALNDVVTISGTVQPGTLVAGQSALVFDGSTADATNRTTFNITEPTAARTINFPDRSGTVVLSGSPTLGNNLAVSTDATGQLVNAIDGQVFNVNSDVINLGNAVGDQITIAGNVKANNGIDVLGGNLAVTNNATVGGTLGVTGATTLGGTLGVTGSTTTNGISNTGTIANTGNITNTLDISTATLSTSGLATLNSASVTTDLTVTGVSTMNGNVTLGNALNDVVTISGTVQPGTLVAGQSALVFDGSTADATNRTTFNITEPTAARTINFPDRSGTVVLSGSPTLGNNLAVSTDATGQLVNAIDGQVFNVNSDVINLGNAVGDQITIAGNVKANNGIDVLGGNLAVTNNATVGGTLGVTGATTLGGTLGVTGSTTTNGISNTGTIANTGNITNTLDISTATLSTSGLATLNSASVTNNVTVSGTLGVAGAISGNQLTSTVADGTAPLIVTSTTPVANLSIGGNAATATLATTVTTNADLSGPIASSGNTTSVTSQTGTGSTFVMDNGPTLIAPALGAATATSLTATGAISGSQLTSTVATGTAPLAVTSTTPVANLSIGGNAATATTATNLATGAGGSIPYQSAANTTALLDNGNAGQVLTSNGTTLAPSWTTPTTGTVTSVSVVSANGLAGSVATAGTTPAITLSTTVSGLLKGNGTAISAAGTGTDYSAGTAALATGILMSTTTTGALSIAGAGDFPTLNQNTTGNAATATTAANLAGGAAGSIPYQTAVNATSLLPAGSAGYVLAMNPAGTAPQWQAAEAGDMILANAQTVTGVKTFNNSAIEMKGSSAGVTTLFSANTSATNYSITLPAATGILATLDGTEVFTNKTLTAPEINGIITGTTIIPEANGGTNQSTYTLGDIIYSSATNTLSKLPGNTTTQRKVLSQTGNGTNSSAPAWIPIGPSQTVLLTGSGSYIVPSDVTYIEVELLGGGGGGAGGTASTNGDVVAGGGGGGGAYTMKGLATSGGTSYTYVVGTGGSGSGASDGSAGGQTQFDGSAITANGGSGGTFMTSGTTSFSVSGGSGGSAGATGDIDIPGASGDRGIRFTSIYGFSGKGGASHYGAESINNIIPASSGSNPGINGSNYGGGGSGATAYDNGPGNQTGVGGNGADGVIIIHEYR